MDIDALMSGGAGAAILGLLGALGYWVRKHGDSGDKHADADKDRAAGERVEAQALMKLVESVDRNMSAAVEMMRETVEEKRDEIACLRAKVDEAAVERVEAEERCRRETRAALDDLERRLSSQVKAAVVDEVARKSTPAHGIPAALKASDG
jgi:hypothetical protein